MLSLQRIGIRSSVKFCGGNGNVSSIPVLMSKFSTMAPATRRKQVSGPVPQLRNLREDVKRIQRKVVKAVTHMIPLNPKFSIEYYPKGFQQNKHFKFDEVLVIYTAHGRFQLRPDYEHNNLVFISHVSGHMCYDYYPEEDAWLSNKFDRHNLIGMLTRDMNQKCMGCPNFNFTEEEFKNTKFTF